MQTDQLLMTQKERDRLVELKKAKKKLITQREAAAEMGVSERQVRRMLKALKKRGDRALVHAGRGRVRRTANLPRKNGRKLSPFSAWTYIKDSD